MNRLTLKKIIKRARSKLRWLRLFPFITLLVAIRHSERAYRRIFRAWYRLYRQPWYQTLFLREHLFQLREFFQEIEPPLPLCEAIALRALGEQLLWGLKKIRTPTAFKAVIQIHGLENLEIARTEGAIIASAHLFLTRFMIGTQLAQLGMPEYVAIGKKPERLIREDIPIDKIPQQMLLQRTQELHQARKVLKRGGLVVILADGRKGLPSEPVRFLKRERPFADGMGQLATFSGNTVLLVDCHLKPDGSFQGNIQPLPKATNENTPGETTQFYRAAYIHWLEKVWQRNPESVKNDHLKKYLASSRAEPMLK